MLGSKSQRDCASQHHANALAAGQSTLQMVLPPGRSQEWKGQSSHPPPRDDLLLVPLTPQLLPKSSTIPYLGKKPQASPVRAGRLFLARSPAAQIYRISSPAEGSQGEEDCHTDRAGGGASQEQVIYQVDIKLIVWSDSGGRRTFLALHMVTLQEETRFCWQRTSGWWM